jgi:hypothetical protein
MTEEQLQLLKRQVAALESIADALNRLAPSTPPNYEHDLSEYKTFDWSRINASVEKRDQYGVAVVKWRGHLFTRRSPSNKFGEAIWFSRCVGKNDSQNTYERLITFKPLSKREAEPLPERVQRHF